MFHGYTFRERLVMLVQGVSAALLVVVALWYVIVVAS